MADHFLRPLSRRCATQPHAARDPDSNSARTFSGQGPKETRGLIGHNAKLPLPSFSGFCAQLFFLTPYRYISSFTKAGAPGKRSACILRLALQRPVELDVATAEAE